MYFKYINNSKYVNKIEELYLNSFPEDERFPFWILQECSKENNSDLYAIFDNDKMIGMCYIVNCANAYYLMYLAVVPSLRNRNYGSMILRDLKENLAYDASDLNEDDLSFYYPLIKSLIKNEDESYHLVYIPKKVLKRNLFS